MANEHHVMIVFYQYKVLWKGKKCVIVLIVEVIKTHNYFEFILNIKYLTMVKGIAWRGMKKIWCLLEIVSIIIKVKIYMFVGD